MKSQAERLARMILDQDVPTLRAAGLRAVFTPKDFDLMDVMDRVLEKDMLRSRDGTPGGIGLEVADE